MAEEPLKDLLDCPVCLGEYNDPRILPCHHSFCKTCLEAVPVELVDGGCVLGCPTCREPCILPVTGVQGLPPSFLLNNLLEMNKKPTPNTEAESQLKTENALTCPVHNRPLDMYCNNCDTLICQFGVAKKHRGHVCDMAEEVYDQFMMPVHQTLTSIEGKLQRMDVVTDKIDTTKKGIRDRCEEIKQRVNEAAQSMIQSVELEQKILLDQIEQTAQVKNGEIQRKEKKALRLKKELNGACDTVTQFLKDNSKLESMACKDKLLEHLASVDKEDNMERLMELGEELEINYHPEQQLEIINLGRITTNLPALRRHRASTMKRRKIDLSIFQTAKWKYFLDKVGVTDGQLKDTETARFILKYIEGNGGIDKAYQELIDKEKQQQN